MVPPPSALDVQADPFELVRDELRLVEEELRADAACDVRAVTEIGDYLRQSGGKRIRPALVLLTAHLCGCEPGPRRRLAAIVEMIHAATLIHDDIIDEAATRRGQPSTNARWGNQRCVLAGDWLYMQSFSLALRERHFGILDALISLTQDMVEGELLQLEMERTVVNPAQHRTLMERKTARLFEVSSQLGAMAAGQSDAVCDRLGRFGRHLGLAFQMVDDILDFTATAEILGKPVGNDLREGKMTLPAIYAYESAAPAQRERMETVMRDQKYTTVSFEEVRDLVVASGALERARTEAEAEAQASLRALREFPASPLRAALERLPELVTARRN